MMTMGVLGELGGSHKWWSTGQTARAWFGAGGEAYLQALRVIDRRYDLLARFGSMPNERHEPGGCNGGAPAGPLAKMVLYYNTQLARSG